MIHLSGKVKERQEFHEVNWNEKQIEKTHKSAAGQEDKTFEEWVSQRVLDETADMINGLEKRPGLR